MILHELGAWGEPDWSRCAIGMASLRAATKIHLIYDRCRISGANMHDSQSLEPLVGGIPPSALVAAPAPTAGEAAHG